ncbi:CDP-diacylglycerol---serine O-phosphatidyltransferase [Colwellia chukchiensis]|uniref:CDP-diacylglycerol---serine O-phosphatidyltransferase n=1 Tax=Colwellia chukchiensis TaxID=641665 RepID=A0A1H7QKU9_9GAMM|nr:CDP-diacylglycerol--serine O-phosphatidyltransferase [Colwellia chukchiensis]SEL48419.1 CDP-diacylglycerol---serine O-phosphatidyltransferase [Colwellia chukchiensis]
MLTPHTRTPIAAENISIGHSAAGFKEQLLAKIAQATTRIYISALYVQDDEAGREVLNALYQAKQQTPNLDICVFVDFHRAQRGLIGDKQHGGNRELYLALEQQQQASINIYGVPVKRKELLGVLHLKGMVFDNSLLYSGASINDIYLQQTGRYRLDRYYCLQSQALADNFCEYMQRCFIDSGYAPRLNQGPLPDAKTLKRNIIRLTKLLKSATYQPFHAEHPSRIAGDIQAAMFVGCGRRNNQLNRVIRELVRGSRDALIIFTPYFNLPKPLLRDLDAALKRGIKVTLVVGDKKANDFYNADEASFSTVEIVPYIYERLLAKFLTRRQKYLDNGNLTLRLWQDGTNSFHLKGMIVDGRYHLLTGSNLNPRAWALDLENAILLDDKKAQLSDKFSQEFQQIIAHTQVISQANEIESVQNYPDKPRKLLRKLHMAQIDKLLKRFL